MASTLNLASQPIKTWTHLRVSAVLRSVLTWEVPLRRRRATARLLHSALLFIPLPHQPAIAFTQAKQFFTQHLASRNKTRETVLIFGNERWRVGPWGGGHAILSWRKPPKNRQVFFSAYLHCWVKPLNQNSKSLSASPWGVNVGAKRNNWKSFEKDRGKFFLFLLCCIFFARWGVVWVQINSILSQASHSNMLYLPS